MLNFNFFIIILIILMCLILILIIKLISTFFVLTIQSYFNGLFLIQQDHIFVNETFRKEF